MTGKRRAALRQDSRSSDYRDCSRKSHQSIAAGTDFIQYTRIAAWILGICFGIMFALGIIGG